MSEGRPRRSTHSLRIGVLTLSYMALTGHSGPAYAQAIFSSFAWRSGPSLSTEAVAFGDIDSDGDLDLICGNRGSAKNLYRNDDGALSATAISFGPPEATTSLALGDVDGDGDLDLLAGNHDRGTALYLNTGGTFADVPIWTTTPDSTRSVSLGDVDGDGDLDLVAGNEAKEDVVYLNDNGTFVRGWSSGTNRLTRSVALGDVDGDGDLDLVTGTDRQFNRFFENSNGSFTPTWTSPTEDATWAIALGDIDGDGALDLVCGNHVQPNAVFLNRGGTYSPDAPDWTSNVPYDTYAVALGDLDADGDLDLVCGNRDQVNTVYINDGGSLAQDPIVFATDQNETFAVALADIDDDGHLDLACGNWLSQTNAVYLNITPLHETLPSTWRSEIPSFTRDIALGDVDDDGDLDLAMANIAKPNAIYRNDAGSLSTTATWSSDDELTTSCLAFGDVDADGDLDLVSGNVDDPHVFYRNDGGSLNPVGMVFGGPEKAQSIALGDVDQDGDLDAVFGNFQRANTLYLFDGSSFTHEPIWSPAAAVTRDVALGDIDGDGWLDLVVANSSGRNAVYRNLGGIFSTEPDSAIWYPAENLSTLGLALADLNGDGQLDIVCANSGTSSDGVYLGNAGSFPNTPSWSSGHLQAPESRSVATGDLDFDGDLDLVFAVGGLSNVVFFNEGGSGRLFPPDPGWSSDEESVSNSVALGDIDADGDLELFFGNEQQQSAMYTGISYPVHRSALEPPSNQLPANGTQLRDVQLASTENVNRLELSFSAVDLEADPYYLLPEYQFRGDARFYPLEIDGGASPVLGPFASTPAGSATSLLWNVERFPVDPRPITVRLSVIETPDRVGVIQHASKYLLPMGPIEPERGILAELSASTLEFGAVTLGDTSMASISFVNRGNVALDVSVDLSSPELTVLPTPSWSVPPNAGQDATFLLMPREMLGTPTPIVLRSNDFLNPAISVAVSASILDLSFETIFAGPEGELPLGEARTVLVQPAAEVHIERAALLVRPIGATRAFTRMEMEPLGGDLFADIPADSVTERGLEYRVEVENSGVFRYFPASDSVIVRTVQSPSRIDLFPPDAVQGTDAVFALSLETGAQLIQAELLHRRGGERAYRSTPFETTGPLIAATIPDSLLGPRGIDYWVSVRTGTTLLTLPAENPEHYPETLPVTVQNVVETRTHGNGRYRMLSFPLRFDPRFTGTIEDLLTDETGFGPYQADGRGGWRTFRYRPSETRYVELSSGTRADFHPEPGRGFWLISRERHQVDTAPVAGTSVNTGTAYPLVVPKGWNQLANPFVFPVAWENLEPPSSIEPPVAYDGSLGERGDFSPDEVIVLMPFEAYFFYNASADPETLWVPPVEASDSLMAMVDPLGTIPAPAKSEKHASSRDWVLELIASSRRGGYARAHLGTRAAARDGIDAHDRRATPPVPGPSIQLGAVHDDWGARSGVYSRDIRERAGIGQRWDITLRNDRAGEEIYLEHRFETAPSADLELRLIDLEQGVSRNLQARDASYSVLSPGAGSSYDFVILAGPAEYVQNQSTLLTSVPRRMVLDQNVPNPFNPSTLLRFGLPRPESVELTIFNLRGERVATLIDDEHLEAGYHTRIWDGHDRNGARVASGVYLYRLVSESSQLSRKMLLIE